MTIDLTDRMHETCLGIAEELENVGNSWQLANWIKNNVLDYEFSVSSDGVIQGFSAYVCLGGPTVWVDTLACTVEGHWATDRTRVSVDRDACRRLEKALYKRLPSNKVRL